MLNRKLSMAWEKWQFEAEEMKRQQMLLRRAAMKMIMREMAKAFCSWQETAMRLRAEKEAMANALRRFINQKMFAAWNQWRSWAAEMRRQQKMMGGAVPYGRRSHQAYAEPQAVYGLGAVAAGLCRDEGSTSPLAPWSYAHDSSSVGHGICLLA
jgi:hypothetical protein